MKLKSAILQVCAIALLSASLCSARAEVVRYQGQAGGSKVQINGTSTIHEWMVEGKIITGGIEFDSSALPASGATPDLNLAALKANPKVEATILVRTLKSANPTMDNVMYQHMKMVQFPKIEYRMTAWTLKEAPKTPGAPAQFDTTGELTIAGVKRTVKMPVTINSAEKDHLKVKGQTDLKMTDFGIQPPAPSLGLGLVKTGDDVKISFEWNTALKPAATAAK